MKKVYDVELMKYIALLENISNVRIKDLFQYNGMLCCIVDKNDVSILVGSEGKKIRKIQDMIHKKIKVVGYSSDVKDFARDLIYPIEVDSIEENNGTLSISCDDRKSKGLLIGRGRQSLLNLQNALSRFFKVDKITVK